jgi:hypothetical protein
MSSIGMDGSASASLDPDIECPLGSPTGTLPKAWLAQTTTHSSRFHNTPVEEGPPVSESPLVFFSSLELVWKYHDQTFLKLRKMRGQRSRQRRMKALRLRLRLLLDRMPWKRTDRASLAEETISQAERDSPDVRLRCQKQTGNAMIRKVEDTSLQHYRRRVIDAWSSEMVRNL